MNSVMIPSLALLLAFGAPLRAQSDDVAALMTEWTTYEQHVRNIKRTLAGLQIRYNGAEDAETKKRLATSYEELTDQAIKQGKELVAKIDRLIAAHPENVDLRRRRLDDTTFDRLSPTIKAKDAEALYELTGDGQYLHRAAELFGNAYDYATAARFWEMAAEKAETAQVCENLGNAYMNIYEFARAKVAFERAHELAGNQRDGTKYEHSAKIAAQYVDSWKQEKALRESSEDLPLVEIVTTRGKMVCELFEDQAPNTVANFIELAEKGFFDGKLFFRNIAYFMMQGGCPENTGRGGPGYNVKDEYGLPDARQHFPGTLSMANTGQPNSGGSQFFVTSVTTSHLNGRHTVFGRVIEGLEAAQVAPMDPTNQARPVGIISIKVTRKRDHPYVVEKIVN